MGRQAQIPSPSVDLLCQLGQEGQGQTMFRAPQVPLLAPLGAAGGVEVAIAACSDAGDLPPPAAREAAVVQVPEL